VRERLRAAGVGQGPGVALGSGDDAAITLHDGRAAATSVDAFVDGIHFRRSTAPAASIGRKALAGALSDLAAMGAEPGEVYVVLGIPVDMDEAACLEVLGGIVEGAADWGVTLAGGDVTRAPVLLLAMTAVGYADSPTDLITRSGASAGDVVVVTGELGGAAAGLMILDRPELGAGLAPQIADALRRRHLEPAPRLAVGRALAGHRARAMIDISDGIAGDGAHIAAASGVLLEIDASELPLDAGVASVAESAGLDPVELALGGGEDYELLACVPSDGLEAATAAVADAGCRLTAIGTVGPGAGLEILNATEAAGSSAGFDQLG
jgi:thiamine-monophosphate kinase